MHPLASFLYCPECGSPRFEVNDFKSKKCKHCGFVYFFNSAGSTAAFITNEKGQLLVARRAKEPAKGTLDLPGGFIDLNETAEEAILREIREETGLTVNHLHYLFSLPNIYEYSGLNVHTIDLFYQCSVNETALQPADDVAELRFLHPEEIQPECFGLTSVRKAVSVWKIKMNASILKK